MLAHLLSHSTQPNIRPIQVSATEIYYHLGAKVWGDELGGPVEVVRLHALFLQEWRDRLLAEITFF